MENYVTFKKKLNVPLFIFLLIFAIVPGIIYFIWSRFPTKICTDPEKGNGSKMRVISAAVAFGAWVVTSLWLAFAANPGVVLSFAFQLIFSLISFLFALLNKKNNKLMLILNIVFAVLSAGFSAWMFWYNWFISVIASIVTIVGCVKGIRHYNYHVLGKGKDEDDEKDEDEDDEE